MPCGGSQYSLDFNSGKWVNTGVEDIPGAGCYEVGLMEVRGAVWYNGCTLCMAY